MTILYIYLTIINIIALAAMAIDKLRARRHRWRIPEHTLLLIAALGGSAGSLIGMLLFWHKVRDKKFAIGLPVMLAVHLALAFIIVQFSG